MGNNASTFWFWFTDPPRGALETFQTCVLALQRKVSLWKEKNMGIMGLLAFN